MRAFLPRLWLVAALSTPLLSGCALPGDTLGVDDATLITVDAEIPLTAELPPLAMAPSDREVSYAFTVVMPVDVIEELEKRGRKKSARTLREQGDKLMAVALNSVEYEILAPNELPVAIDPVRVYIAPEGVSTPDATAREIGHTEAIAPHEVFERRTIVLTSTGLPDASVELTSLKFSLLFDAALRVPRAQSVPAKALRAKLRLKLTARVDLAG